MPSAETYHRQLDQISAALQDKLALRPAPFAKLIARSKSKLPRRVFLSAEKLVAAQSIADHPKLNRTLDFDALARAGDVVLTHLEKIDTSERRKDRLLSMLGSMAFGILGLAVLVIVVLRWRGFI
jgi:hypothetical protein